jgi:Sulfotransferase family
MLRLMLDGHPELAMLPETHFLPRLPGICATSPDPVAQALEAIVTTDRWSSFGLDAGALRERANTTGCETLSDVVRLFYREYAARHGKQRWGDKTPWYVLRMPMIARLLGEARFVHIIRDGRDVALSVIPLWWGPTSVADAARWWAERIRSGRRDAAEVPYLEVLYERLVEQPEAELRRICAFIELEYDAGMLEFDARVRADPARVAPHLVGLSLDAALAAEPDQFQCGLVSPEQMQAQLARRLSGPPDGASIGRWRALMSADELRSFDEIAGDLLEELGYAPS